MSIVIEGCDCTGKTSFHKALNWPVIKGDKFKRGRDSLDHWDKVFEPGYNILSRWWPTEYIYGNQFRGGSACTIEDMWRYKLFGDVNGTVLIWLTASWLVIKDRHKDRGDTISLRYMEEIHDAYKDFFDKWSHFLPPTYSLTELSFALFDHYNLQKRAAKFKCFDVDSSGTLTDCKVLVCGKGVTKRNIYKGLAKSEIRPGTIHIMDILSETCGNWEAAIDFLEPEEIISTDAITTNKLLTHIGAVIAVEAINDYTQTK